MKLCSLFALAAGGALAVASLPAAAAAPYEPGADAWAFRDSRIQESSGVVASSQHDEAWYTHNDSGHPGQVFTVDGRGCTIGVLDLLDAAGAELAVTDVEDIALGPDGAGGPSMIWLGDIGDNFHQRGSIAVHAVPEAAVHVSSAGHAASDTCPAETAKTAVPTTYELVYPDTAHDAETLLADPVDGQLYIVTKSPTLTSFVYEAPMPLVAGEANVLTRVAEIVWPLSTTYDKDPAVIATETAAGNPQVGFDATGRLWAVGGDIAPDRDRLVVRTYTDAFEWSILPGQELADVFRAAPLQIPLEYEKQGEAIAYTRDGVSLLTTCEDSDFSDGGCTAHFYEGTSSS